MKLREEIKKQGRMDFLLFGTIIAICVFGLVMVLSASYYSSYSEYGDGFREFSRQAGFFAFGLVVLLVASAVPFKVYQSGWVSGIFALVVAALCFVVIFFGKSDYGAQRWIQVAGISIQPSELAKPAVVLVMSCYIAQFPQGVRRFRGFMIACVIFVLMISPILAQSNLSTLMILGAIFIFMLFIGNVPIKYIAMIGGVALLAGTCMAVFTEYRMERLMSFTNPWKDPSETGYQLIQSLIAIGSGGFFGTGLNFSRQKLLFLTFGDTDFIFAIIAEELGFFGCVLLLLAYGFVIYRGIRIAMRCRMRFGALLAGGLTATIGIQAMVHIMVALGIFPTTGQTLPFISSGGSSLIVFMGLAGILLNISRYDVTNQITREPVVKNSNTNITPIGTKGQNGQ